MPYPNEFAARMHEPSSLSNFRRKRLTKGIDAIFAMKDGKMIIQTYRFSKDVFTTEKVRNWLSSRKLNPISVEVPLEVRTDAVDHSLKALQKQIVIKKIREQRNKKRRVKRMYRPKYPRMLEAQYVKTILEYVDKMQAMTQSIISPQLSGIIDQAGFRQDAWNDSVDNVIESLKVSFDKELPDFSVYASDIGQKTSDWSNKEWQKTMKSVMQVEFYQNEPWLSGLVDSFVKQNVNLITKLTSETTTDIHGIVDRGIVAGKRHETIMKEIISGTDLQKGKFQTVRTRARLIARDQVAKLNGNLMRLRQTNLGITHYIWRTSLDERVRPTHAALEGKRFSWDNPPDVGNPGEDYQCRCTAEPDFQELLDTSTEEL